MMNRLRKIIIFLFTIGVIASSVLAASSKITYQGQLRENGVPVTDNKTMVFGIFTSSTGGTAVWTSGSQTVSVISGLFRTLLEPTGVDWETTLYLEVEVEGTTLSPREELTASPYAIDALLLSGKAYTNAASAPSSPSVGDLWFNTTSNTLNIWSGSAWDQISSGGSGGGTVTVENGDTVIEASASSIDFSATYFTVTSGPSGEANVSLTANSISDSEVSNSAAIQLSKLEKDPSQTGTINNSTNPVDWSQLKNVPAAFSDGVDNTGGGSPVIEENDTVVDAAATNIDFLGANFNVTSSPAGEANIALDASSVTLQGNTFNAANRLVQLDGSGNMPALNGSALTNLTAVRIIEENNSSVVSDATNLDFDGGQFNIAADGGSEADISLNPSSVTLQGNDFNGSNQLVRLNASAELTIGSSGTPISEHLSATASLDFGILGALTCESLNVTVTGAADGDTVYLGIPNALASVDVGIAVFNAYVSAADTVTVKRCGLALGSSNPSAATVRVDVWKH